MAEQLERDIHVELGQAYAMPVEFRSEYSILSPSKSPLTRLPLGDGKPNTQSDFMPLKCSQPAAPLSVASAVVKMLEEMGVKYAFGVSGGAIAPLWATLQHSSLQMLHFRHEAGAAFAAVEAYFASGRPVVVFTTTGPGITNALTGLFAARWEGAKVISYRLQPQHRSADAGLSRKPAHTRCPVRVFLLRDHCSIMLLPSNAAMNYQRSLEGSPSA